MRKSTISFNGLASVSSISEMREVKKSLVSTPE